MLLDEGLELIGSLDANLVASAEALALVRTARGEREADPAKAASERPAKGAAKSRRSVDGGGGAAAGSGDAAGSGGAAAGGGAHAGAAESDSLQDATSALGAPADGMAATGGTAGASDEGDPSAAAPLLPGHDASKEAGGAVAGVPPPPDARKPVRVDEAQLVAFCARLVERCTGWSVDGVSMLMCDLYGCLAHEQKRGDGTALLGTLDAAVQERQRKLASL